MVKKRKVRRGKFLPARLGVLRIRDFRLFYVGYATSLLGTAMSSVAIAFAFLGSGGTATGLGVVFTANIVPMVAFMLVGGALADRLGRRRVMLAADLVRCAAQVTLAAVLFAGHPSLWLFATAALAVGTGNAFFSPALAGLPVQLAPPGRLGDANALLGAARPAAQVAGPALAGILIAVTGPAPVIAVDASTYALSALALAGLRIKETATEIETPGSRLRSRSPYTPTGYAWRIAGRTRLYLPRLTRDHGRSPFRGGDSRRSGRNVPARSGTRPPLTRDHDPSPQRFNAGRRSERGNRPADPQLVEPALQESAPRDDSAPRDPDARRGLLGRDLSEGWAEFIAHPWLWPQTVQFALFNLVTWGPYLVLGPVLAEQYLGGARAWGVVLACYGGGAILGSLSALGRRPRRPLLVATLATFGYAFPPLALALHLPLPAVAGAALAAGLGSALSGAFAATVEQRLIPAEALSRVGAFNLVGAFAFGPVAFIAAGPEAAAFGPRAVLAFGAAWSAAMTLGVLAFPAIRRQPWPEDGVAD